MDLTKPIPGEVVDGIRTDFDDIQFSSSPAKVEVQWTNYSDPESTIEKYEVQVEAARYYKYNDRGVIKSPKRNGRLVALFGFCFIKSAKRSGILLFGSEIRRQKTNWNLFNKYGH